MLSMPIAFDHGLLFCFTCQYYWAGLFFANQIRERIWEFLRVIIVTTSSSAKRTLPRGLPTRLNGQLTEKNWKTLFF
jgi:hypothetical protein